MKYPDGEGPAGDRKAAKERARLERQKPEHAYRKVGDKPDPRDKAGEADLDDPALQEGDD